MSRTWRTIVTAFTLALVRVLVFVFVFALIAAARGAVFLPLRSALLPLTGRVCTHEA